MTHAEKTRRPASPDPVFGPDGDPRGLSASEFFSAGCGALKLPHHGEDEEHSVAFLKMMDPAVCIVTAPAAGPVTARMMQQLEYETCHTAQGGAGLLDPKESDREETTKNWLRRFP